MTLKLLGGLPFGHLCPEARSGPSELPAQLLKRAMPRRRSENTCMAERLDWLNQLLEQEVSLEPCFLLFQ